MAIWLTGRELEKTFWLLYQAEKRGEELVLFPIKDDLYEAKDFLPLMNTFEAREVSSLDEDTSIAKISQFNNQLNRCRERGYGEFAVIADYQQMDLESGNIFSDMRKIGLSEPSLEKRAYEQYDKWDDVFLRRPVH